MDIINGKIFPMEGEPIPNGYLRVEHGIIARLGAMENYVPLGDETLDVQGASVYPGFVDAHTHLGMWEDGLGFEGDDGNEDTDPSTPHMRALDGVNPYDRCFEEALWAGVTTVLTGPGSSNPVGGQMIAMKTQGGTLDDMVLLAPCAMKFALGENPKTTYHGKNQMPTTRMATAAIIREQLYKAARYAEDKRRAAEDEALDAPEYDMKCEAMLPLLRGEIPAHFHAHRADDIGTAIRIAGEFGIRFSIVHATEGHLIVDVLSREHVSVLAGPLLCDRSKPELKNLTPEAAGILHRAGVPIALVTDHPEIPVQYLPLTAALAVREGLNRMAALRAITIDAARICGLDKRVGSLSVGKDADFVVFDGDPLNMMNKPKIIFIQGNRVV